MALTLRVGLGLGLALLGAGLGAATPAWDLGGADAYLLASGYRQDPHSQAWSAEVTLRLVNRDMQRPYHQALKVEFLGANGKVWDWKTFVSLDPGAAQHRRVSAPSPLDCQGPLAGCPGLKVRVFCGVRSSGTWVDLTRSALDEAPGPPEGVPLYVARVLGPGLLELVNGPRVRVLGLAVTQGRRGQNQAALRRTWGLVMESSIQLSYDGVRRGADGAWLAHVRLGSGQDLAKILLAEGLQRLDAAGAGRLAKDYGRAEAAARAHGRGLWGSPLR